MMKSKFFGVPFTLIISFFVCSNSFAQDEFELLYDLDKGFSKAARDQIISQWSAHAKTVNQNPNCLTSIENQLNAAIDKNLTALGIGTPFLAQINYSNCKLEKFTIDTLKNSAYSPQFISYHISGCIDPNKALTDNTNSANLASEVPLLVTYRSNDANGSGWMGYDHYGYTKKLPYENDVFKELFYDPKTLKFRCESNGYKIYEIKNATKHAQTTKVEESLKAKGVNVQDCLNKGSSIGAFNGRYQMQIEKFHDLEVRYILVHTGNGRKKLLIRFINRHTTLSAKATVKKGIDGKSGIPTTYEIEPNSIFTINLNELVELDYQFVVPTEMNGRSNSLIQMAKEIIRRQITIDQNGKGIKIEKLAVVGVRG